MTDAPTADELAASTLPPEEVDPERVRDETQAELTLAGRLAGVKHRDDKVLVFLDEKAADALVEIESEMRGLEWGLKVLQTDPAGEEDPQRTEDRRVEAEKMQAKIDERKPAQEEARVAALQSALAIYLVGAPDPARKSASRQMRQIYAVDGQVPGDRVPEAADWLNENLLGHSIAKIVDSNGNALTLPKRDEVGPMLQKQLPASQWKVLMDRFLALSTKEAYAQAAQDDPGF